jgi:hypothetical protein
VIRKTEFDNGVPADKTPLPRRHFFAHHPAMAAAEQVYQAVGRNGLRTERGGMIEGIPLALQKLLATR